MAPSIVRPRPGAAVRMSRLRFGQFPRSHLDDLHPGASSTFELALPLSGAGLVVGDGGCAGYAGGVGPGDAVVRHGDRHGVIIAAGSDSSQAVVERKLGAVAVGVNYIEAACPSRPLGVDLDFEPSDACADLVACPFVSSDKRGEELDVDRVGYGLGLPWPRSGLARVSVQDVPAALSGSLFGREVLVTDVYGYRSRHTS
jgi:hypothetical protein